MSNGWSVKSKGAPYLAFVQAAAGMTAAAHAPGERGPFRLALEVAFDALPSQNASADEVHRLFSYQDGGIALSPPDLMSLGVTPSGRLVGLTPNSGVTQSATGVIVADGITRELALDFNVAGFATLSLNGVELVLLNAVPAVYPLPTGVGQMMLFNGGDGLARYVARIRRASWTEQFRTITWPINEGQDQALKATTTADTSDPSVVPFTQDFTLRAGFSTGTEPWGPWDEIDDPAVLYAWVVSTAYTRLAPPSTRYERSQA